MNVEDYGSTTAVIAYVRKRLTPTVLWSAIGALVTALVVCITWIITMQSDVHQLKDSVGETKKSVADTQQQFQQLLDLSHKIDTQNAVMTSKLDNIADEVDRQREWREKIEGIAETPPHARKRR